MHVFKAIIIDDEKNVREALKPMLAKHCPEIELCGMATSAAEGLALLLDHKVDFIFLDISMPGEDGFGFLSSIPSQDYGIIFTTAHQEFALTALKANAIDYLLKPFTREAVEKSLEKIEVLSAKTVIQPDIRQLIDALKPEKNYKTHFLVEIKGNKMIPLLAADIAFFYTESGKVIAKTHEQAIFPVDFNLDELAAKLNPADFFRANRQFIISRKSIKDVEWWFNSRLSINLKVSTPEKILVSRTRVAEFKNWFAGE